MAVSQLNIAAEKDKHFCCLFPNAQHQLIAFGRPARGTINRASIYPKIVVRPSLELNTAAIIFTHNPPSGVTKPSKKNCCNNLAPDSVLISYCHR